VKVIRILAGYIFCDFDAYILSREHAKRSGLQSRFTRRTKAKDVSTANQRTKAPKFQTNKFCCCILLALWWSGWLRNTWHVKNKQKVRPNTSLSCPQLLEHSGCGWPWYNRCRPIWLFHRNVGFCRKGRGGSKATFFATSQVDDGVNPCSIFTKVWLCAWTGGERAAAPRGHYSHSR
jgi:hypothetical protein